MGSRLCWICGNHRGVRPYISWLRWVIISVFSCSLVLHCETGAFARLHYHVITQVYAAELLQWGITCSNVRSFGVMTSESIKAFIASVILGRRVFVISFKSAKNSTETSFQCEVLWFRVSLNTSAHSVSNEWTNLVWHNKTRELRWVSHTGGGEEQGGGGTADMEGRRRVWGMWLCGWRSVRKHTHTKRDRGRG